MLSGKSQYYNSVKKESIKKLNSVSFCPNPSVSEAVKTSLVMTRSCPTTDQTNNPPSPSPSNPSIDPQVSNPSIDPQISNPSIDPQISNPSIDPQGSNPPSNPKSVSNHSLDPQGSNLPSNPKSVSNHSLDPQVSNPSPTQTNSKESNLYINPSNADLSNSEPMVSNISSDPRLSISSMDPAYVAHLSQTKTTNPSCTSQNLSTEDNTISTDENIKSANQSQINPTINRNVEANTLRLNKTSIQGANELKKVNGHISATLEQSPTPKTRSCSLNSTPALHRARNHLLNQHKYLQEGSETASCSSLTETEYFLTDSANDSVVSSGRPSPQKFGLIENEADSQRKHSNKYLKDYIVANFGEYIEDLRGQPVAGSDDLEECSRDMSSPSGSKDEVEKQQIVTIINAKFETLPLGLNQDIPDVFL